MFSVMVQMFVILYCIWHLGWLKKSFALLPFYFLCVVPFGTYLSDDEDIGIFVEFASGFCKSEFMVLLRCLSN